MASVGRVGFVATYPSLDRTGTTDPLGAETQQTKEAGYFHEALSLPVLGVSQNLSSVLLVEQGGQPLLYTLGEPKPC